MRKRDFFKMVWVWYENQISEVGKNRKTSGWNLELDKKVASSVFQKVCARASGGHFFFLDTIKKCAKERSLN